MKKIISLTMIFFMLAQISINIFAMENSEEKTESSEVVTTILSSEEEKLKKEEEENLAKAIALSVETKLKEEEYEIEENLALIMSMSEKNTASDDAFKKVVGLVNKGAYCFINALIQQLYNLPEIRNDTMAIDDNHTKYGDKLLSLKDSFKRICESEESTVDINDLENVMIDYKGADSPSFVFEKFLLEPLNVNNISSTVLTHFSFMDTPDGEYSSNEKLNPLETTCDNVIINTGELLASIVREKYGKEIPSKEKIEDEMKSEINSNRTFIPDFINTRKDGNRVLTGFIVSTGVYGGHYYSFIQKDGLWWCVNDTSVESFESFDNVRERIEDQGLFISLLFYSK